MERILDNNETQTGQTEAEIEGASSGIQSTELEDEITVSIGEDSSTSEQEEPEKAPEWVRDLRKKYRESEKEKAELRKKLDEISGTAKVVELGKKPAIEDFDYDTDLYENALLSWQDAKRTVEQKKQKELDEAEEQKMTWSKKLQTYQDSKADVKVKDFEEAEAEVLDVFSTIQQGIIIQGADNAALTVYAIGKNPQKLKELSEIKDPVKFAFAIAKLEGQLKVNTKKPNISPESKIVGAAPVGTSAMSKLDELRAVAEKTGDYSEVIKFKRQMKKEK